MQKEDSSTSSEQEKGRGMRFSCLGGESDESGLFVYVLIKVFPTFAGSLKRANRCQVVLEAMSPSLTSILPCRNRVGVDSVVRHRLGPNCASPEMPHNNCTGSEALSYGLRKWLFLSFP